MKQKKLKIPIVGMTCGACAMHVEKKLNQSDSILKAVVNLPLKEAVLDIDYTKITVNDLIKIVEEAGYTVPQDNNKFTIERMACASCAAHIEKQLNKMDNIITASVNFATGVANIGSLQGKLQANDVINLVEKLGYSAIDVSRTSDNDKGGKNKAGKQWCLSAFSAVLTLPLFMGMFAHLFQWGWYPKLFVLPVTQLVLASIVHSYRAGNFIKEHTLT